MDPKLLELYKKLKKQGLSAEREERILRELRCEDRHGLPGPPPPRPAPEFYGFGDLMMMQRMSPEAGPYVTHIRSIDELLERDRQREEDGFPRKVRVGRMIKPGRSGKDKVVVVPTTVEEKFIHDPSFAPPGEGTSSGGSGEGEEGEVIGETPVRPEGGEGGEGAGQGEGGAHEVEASAYDLGRILTEKFELPNLKEKGKKRSLTRFTYELTDRNRGFGQLLDKKATLRRILETNISLGNLPDTSDIDPTRFLIAPDDKVYRILSREREMEAQAIVFFLRDYSGSMGGKATDLVVTQHVLIFSWLLYQYDRQVETRFILHDTEAREVPDFQTYYNSTVAGGTQVSSAFSLVNEIVDKEGLAADYNIYVFHGTDGDDWDSEGKHTLPQVEKMLRYASRVGITIAEHSYTSSGNTEVERYLKKSGLLETKSDLVRLDSMDEASGEPRLIEGIKKLIG
ncbi:DUF444 family protein [uncultured Desulfuromonas sp.]|uniref:DUF444 family protein n=1 Tax=uncultured Desulfuromonas sp. TaxID=181013 RepID=UPI00261D0EA2|nr:DUF444 family protein [uncultured Desulfuromonas sp.]